MGGLRYFMREGGGPNRFPARCVEGLFLYR